mmetsp:Transcript_110407/g.321451  ORF Transcript_110407/g.321451 Transcript_110407/m.321451 type:complete len:204 (-) Transcript_110407:137-748(-)|eukprot:CAMPEP_0119541092 /NCGR_PEP_ID=MMETSP1344-20130328/52757_1 /TAXON_ID=236787 /ORGANISM="Florenciella parvula, Strain CCMP2471" /LENGTH=203 /DNA_ID=CAMNT_0007585013 /DNA_START=69 /DNA_END=680 /DNA_ORIENTATION=-
MAAMANTLFVGNLPFNTSDDDIALAFAAYGCTSAKMQYHEDSGRSKGWALVTVSTDLATVAEQMNDTDFQGRNLLVREDRGKVKKEPREPRAPRQQGEKPARKPRAPRDENEVVPENNIIFVGNLPWDVDSDSLAAFFPGHIEANVQTSRDGRSAGYGLVTYENVALATDAITLNNGMDIGGRTVFCRYDRGKTPKFNAAAEY